MLSANCIAVDVTMQTIMNTLRLGIQMTRFAGTVQLLMRFKSLAFPSASLCSLWWWESQSIVLRPGGRSGKELILNQLRFQLFLVSPVERLERIWLRKGVEGVPRPNRHRNLATAHPWTWSISRRSLTPRSCTTHIKKLQKWILVTTYTKRQTERQPA